MATRSFSTEAPHAQEALAIFQEIDANQDGRLSLEELMGGSADHGMTDAEIEQLFMRLDTDGDGTISQEEWVEGYVQLSNEVKLELKRRRLLGLATPEQPIPSARTCKIELTEERAVTLGQLQCLARLAVWVLGECELIDDNKYSATVGRRIVWDITNMYHLCTHIVMPLTCKPWACSWVEMVAVQAQKPVWFVSQCVPRRSFAWMGWLSVGVGGSAWSTRLHQTLEMVEWHVEVHQLSGDTPYWICTLAK